MVVPGTPRYMQGSLILWLDLSVFTLEASGDLKSSNQHLQASRMPVEDAARELEQVAKLW